MSISISNKTLWKQVLTAPESVLCLNILKLYMTGKRLWVKPMPGKTFVVFVIGAEIQYHIQYFHLATDCKLYTPLIRKYNQLIIRIHWLYAGSWDGCGEVCLNQ